MRVASVFVFTLIFSSSLLARPVVVPSRVKLMSEPHGARIGRIEPGASVEIMRADSEFVEVLITGYFSLEALPTRVAVDQTVRAVAEDFLWVAPFGKRTALLQSHVRVVVMELGVGYARISVTGWIEGDKLPLQVSDLPMDSFHVTTPPEAADTTVQQAASDTLATGTVLVPARVKLFAEPKGTGIGRVEPGAVVDILQHEAGFAEVRIAGYLDLNDLPQNVGSDRIVHTVQEGFLLATPFGKRTALLKANTRVTVVKLTEGYARTVVTGWIKPEGFTPVEVEGPAQESAIAPHRYDETYPKLHRPPERRWSPYLVASCGIGFSRTWGDEAIIGYSETRFVRGYTSYVCLSSGMAKPSKSDLSTRVGIGFDISYYRFSMSLRETGSVFGDVQTEWIVFTPGIQMFGEKGYLFLGLLGLGTGHSRFVEGPWIRAYEEEHNTDVSVDFTERTFIGALFPIKIGVRAWKHLNFGIAFSGLIPTSPSGSTTWHGTAIEALEEPELNLDSWHLMATFSYVLQ